MMRSFVSFSPPLVSGSGGDDDDDHVMRILFNIDDDEHIDMTRFVCVLDSSNIR